jgi:hypothetical protein
MCIDFRHRGALPKEQQHLIQIKSQILSPTPLEKDDFSPWRAEIPVYLRLNLSWGPL